MKNKNKVYTFTIKHKKYRKEVYWTTMQGATMLLKDMEDSHLVNTILYLNRKVDKLREYDLPILPINDKEVSEWLEILNNELEHRGLHDRSNKED
jgi:hypothetical protein